MSKKKRSIEYENGSTREVIREKTYVEKTIDRFMAIGKPFTLDEVRLANDTLTHCYGDVWDIDILGELKLAGKLKIDRDYPVGDIRYIPL